MARQSDTRKVAWSGNLSFVHEAARDDGNDRWANFLKPSLRAV